MRLEAGAAHYALRSLEDQAEFSSETSDLAECICPLSTDRSNRDVRTVFARCLEVPLHFPSCLKFGHLRSWNHFTFDNSIAHLVHLEMQISETEALFYISRLSAILQRQRHITVILGFTLHALFICLQ